MIPIWLIKFAGNRIYKAIKHNKELKKIDKYVNKPNELDIKIKDLENANVILSKELDLMYKKADKYGKYIEELDTKVATLSIDSHPPIFGNKDKNNIIKRLTKLEKGE